MFQLVLVQAVTAILIILTGIAKNFQQNKMHWFIQE